MCCALTRLSPLPRERGQIEHGLMCCALTRFSPSPQGEGTDRARTYVLCTHPPFPSPQGEGTDRARTYVLCTHPPFPSPREREQIEHGLMCCALTRLSPSPQGEGRGEGSPRSKLNKMLPVVRQLRHRLADIVHCLMSILLFQPVEHLRLPATRQLF